MIDGREGRLAPAHGREPGTGPATYRSKIAATGDIRVGGPILSEPEEPKDHLPATIASAEVTADQRAPNVVPALIADLGDEAAWRYVEFFTANIRNPNTRRAYARACSRFFAWCEDRGLTPAAIRPHDVATYMSPPI
jgi:hypothetical protein